MKNIIISILLISVISCNRDEKINSENEKISIKDSSTCFDDFDFFRSIPVLSKSINSDSTYHCLYKYNKNKLYNTTDTNINYKIGSITKNKIFSTEFYIGGMNKELIILSLNNLVFKIVLHNTVNNPKKISYFHSVEIINKNNECEEYEFKSGKFVIANKQDLLNIIEKMPYKSFEDIPFCNSGVKYNLVFKKNEVILNGFFTYIDEDLNNKLVTRNYNKIYETQQQFNLSSWIFYGSNFMVEKSD